MDELDELVASASATSASLDYVPIEDYAITASSTTTTSADPNNKPAAQPIQQSPPPTASASASAITNTSSFTFSTANTAAYNDGNDCQVLVATTPPTVHVITSQQQQQQQQQSTDSSSGASNIATPFEFIPLNPSPNSSTASAASVDHLTAQSSPSAAGSSGTGGSTGISPQHQQQSQQQQQLQQLSANSSLSSNAGGSVSSAGGGSGVGAGDTLSSASVASSSRFSGISLSNASSLFSGDRSSSGSKHHHHAASANESAAAAAASSTASSTGSDHTLVQSGAGGGLDDANCNIGPCGDDQYVGPDGQHGGIILDIDGNKSSAASSVAVAAAIAAATAAASTITSPRQQWLPWGSHTRSSIAATAGIFDMPAGGDGSLRPGEIVMRTLFADFTQQCEKKIETVMMESSDKNLAKLLQRGEDPQFDQLLSTFGTVAEHCLPSLLYALLAWYRRQQSDALLKNIRQEKMAAAANTAAGGHHHHHNHHHAHSVPHLYVVNSASSASGSGASGTVAANAAAAASGSVSMIDLDAQLQRRESAVEFIFCLALIEILRQLHFHPGHEDILKNFENLAFKHFKYRDGLQSNPNAHNIHMIADLYAEVIGVLAQSRFCSVRKRFMSELKELRAKEPSPHTTQSIISLLMGMKFFRVKMVPIEEFEASFQFMHECAQYFLEVKDKDIKHALAGLFVEILVPVAAAVKNEVNVPCVKNFVDLLYTHTLDLCAKSKHKLALFPLVTCLLCVSQKTVFINGWHYFLAMCLSNLKNRDPKLSRVALESLYRLLWVYMIRIKCESNSATHSRLQSIVNSLFPKGSKAVVPRDTPLNIFVKIIQFIAQERLDFAMREIVFELLCVGRPFKIIMNPERMSIGLRAFLVVADSLQQKDGEPPMPRTVGVLPSGNTLRVKKTYINKMLTDDTARSIGMSSYFPYVRRTFVDILRALDVHYGRPLMLTNTQNQNKEPDEMLTGERKPRIDLFRTCVAAVPRLIPDTMTMHELVDLLSRLTVHMDEELRTLAHQSLQTLIADFPDWRQEVIHGYTQFLVRDVVDTFPQLVDSCARLLLVFVSIWRSTLGNSPPQMVTGSVSQQQQQQQQTKINAQQQQQPSKENAASLASANPTTVPSTNTAKISSTVTSTASTASSLTSRNTQSTVLNQSASATADAASRRTVEQPLATTMHFVQALCLVLLCNVRSYPRKLAVHILKECKQLSRALGLPETEPPLIDVLDKYCPVVLERCMAALPPAEKTAVLNATVVDLQWLADRTCGVWTSGCSDDSAKGSTLVLNANAANANAANGGCINTQTPIDPWSQCLFGFLEKNRVPLQCPAVAAQAWPICYQRLTSLFTVIDPTPVSDNRASLLRSSAPPKKTPTESQRDVMSRLWKNQVAMAMRLAPAVPSVSVRCASPDLSLSMHDTSDSRSLSDSLDNIPSNVFGPDGIVTRFTLPLSYGRKDARHKRVVGSSPDSLTADRADKSSTTSPSPVALYKLVVPLLRCEVSDVRDAAVNALSLINQDALKDLMEELVLYIREAVDRKQENMRRRRRRDALRLQLVKVLEQMAANQTFGISSCVIERDSMSLHPTFVEYIEGARLYLETETEKDNASIREVKTHFCNFIRIMIKSFSLESCITLLSRDLKRNLFKLFATWGGPYARQFNGISESNSSASNSNGVGGVQPPHEEMQLQFSALSAMSAVLCCGPCFDPHCLAEDGIIYPWLDMLLTSKQDNVYKLTRDTVVLLLECNPDIGQVLEWVIDRCYTADSREADACFLSLAAVFSTREYPCDHYTSVINVTLLMTECPRVAIQSTGIQLLQLLDKRFFGTVRSLHPDGDRDEDKLEPTDVLLSSNVSRTQMHLSKQMAQLRPELTMPMFSEITHRFQTARVEVQSLLLQCLQPWLENMELVAASVPPATPLSYIVYYSDAGTRSRREGSGSTEATEMILNNLFYITAKFADAHPRDIEVLWGTLCQYWPNNLKVVLRYLVIVVGLAPAELIPCAKRVALYLARTGPNRLFDELMNELQTVETLNCMIERTETPPFYRLTSLRKASSHSDGPTGAGGTTDSRAQDLAVEKGTIHTKRHSGEDHIKNGTCKSDSGLRSFSANYRPPRGSEKIRAASGPSVLPRTEDVLIKELELPADESFELRTGEHQPPNTGIVNNPNMMSTMNTTAPPHPLPMPEYGGYFAPLTEFLPDIGLPISGFHRCNVAVMLLTDIVVEGIDGIDLALNIPLMLHILFLGLDHTRSIVRDHCKALLLNLLVVLAEHNDHLTVARIILNSGTNKFNLGLSIPQLAVTVHNFTEPDAEFDCYLYDQPGVNCVASNVQGSNSGNDNNGSSQGSSTIAATAHTQNAGTGLTTDKSTDSTETVLTVTATSVGQSNVSTRCDVSLTITDDHNTLPLPGPAMTIAHVTKSLIHFLSQETAQPLWNYEDITAKVWSIKSAEQLTCFLRHILKVYAESYAQARIAERWAQTALQLGLSCSSRHYAGRSLQVFRALNVPINSRMLSDILSRLVETVAEQGEDMQGYVTELLLTLEAAVDSLDSDFRPLDVMKDIFKSTPNLNNKDGGGSGGVGLVGCKKSPSSIAPLAPSHMSTVGHTRSTSYSVSYCTRKVSNSPIEKQVELRNRATVIEMERNTNKFGPSALSRSRSAQSLKLLSDTSTQDDKMTILAQLFWLAVSLLESDYEHEFLLACRLLSRVLHRLPLDRPDARDKVEKLQQQLKWTGYPGVHALLLKGCTYTSTYEPTITLLSQLALLLNLPVCDPTQSCAFPMNVIALLPYMLLHYEDANEVCIRSAENIAHVSSELGAKLENLGTVMTLYSRKTFSKESFQWTKCVVKYLYDTYAYMGLHMLAFLIEVLEKGQPQIQVPVLNVIHCMLHYIDLSSTQAQPISGDLLRVIARYLDNLYWKEALKILKLVVTRSSSLQVVPQGSPTTSSGGGSSHLYHGSFSDSEVFSKKELAGRTMEFSFDISQTPLIGRRILLKSETTTSVGGGGGGATPATYRHTTTAASTSAINTASASSGDSHTVHHSTVGPLGSPRRSASLSPADTVQLSGWKRPWMSQGRVRECLVSLLTTCGQRVGLPKSPSVIFSQSSDLMERQSSAASSTEETSGAQQDLSGTSRRDDGHADFGVFKDFDFLEYESESIEGESTDNFNWGVRRRPLSEGDGSEPLAGNSSSAGGGGGDGGGGSSGGGGTSKSHSNTSNTTTSMMLVGGVGGHSGGLANDIGSPLGAALGYGASGSGHGTGLAGSGLIGGIGSSGLTSGVAYYTGSTSHIGGGMAGASGGGSKTNSILEECLSEQTPTMSKRRPHRHTLDESSDEDLESESPLDEYHKPLYQKLAYLGGPPTSLGLRERHHHHHRQRRDSISRSDTSGSSAGDLGDITPCNASPHMPHGLLSFRAPPMRDEAEEQWRRDMLLLLANQPAMQAVDLVWQLSRLIRALTAKCVAVAKEASKYFTGHGATLGERIVVLADLLAAKEDAPRIWYNQDQPTTLRLFETLRFGVLEVQEHLETFFDRKDHVLECLESMRSARKTTLFSDTESTHEAASAPTSAAQQAAAAAIDAATNEVLVELGRSVYKLMFQLMLLIESDHKIAVNVQQSLQLNGRITDLSPHLADTRGAILRSMDDAEPDSLDTSTSTECGMSGEGGGGGATTPTASPGPQMTAGEFEMALVHLIEQQRWTAVMAHVRQHKMLSNVAALIGGGCGGGGDQADSVSDGAGAMSFSMVDGQTVDDLSMILNIYSQRLIRDRNDVFIASRTEDELTTMQTVLMENVYHVSGALSAMEAAIKEGNSPGGSNRSSTNHTPSVRIVDNIITTL